MNARSTGIHPRIEAPGIAKCSAEDTLRGGGVSRNLKPIRRAPRERWAEVFGPACDQFGISDGELAKCFGFSSDREGAEVRSGRTAVACGEMIDNGPIHPMLVAFIARFIARADAERRQGNVGDAALLMVAVDALRRASDAIRPAA